MKKFRQMSLLKKILCIVLVFIVAGVVFNLGDDKNDSKETKDQETSETKETEKEYGIGELVNVGDVDYIVNRVETGKTVGNQYLNASAKDTYLIVDITITNHEKEALSVSDSFFKLLNGESEYSTDTNGAIYLDDSIIYQEINPEVTLQGKIIFDVPELIANDNQTKLQVQTGTWGTEKETISLAR